LIASALLVFSVKVLPWASVVVVVVVVVVAEGAVIPVQCMQ
jgi:hypothetical protein